MVDQPGLVAGDGLCPYRIVTSFECVQQVRHHPRVEGGQAAEAQHAGHLGGELAGSRYELACLQQQAFRLAQNTLALRGQGQALGVMADEQLDAELGLEIRDRGGDRRLRNVHPLRGERDAAGLGGGDEVFDLLQREAQHVGAFSADRVVQYFRNRRSEATDMGKQGGTACIRSPPPMAGPRVGPEVRPRTGGACHRACPGGPAIHDLSFVP